MTAEPPEVSRKVTCRGLPSEVFPSQVPVQRFELGEGFLGVGLGEAAVAARATKSSGSDASGFGHDVFLSQFFLFEFHGLGLREACGLAGVLGFDKGFQVGQAGAPEDAVLLDPGVDGAERFGIQLVDAVAAFAMFADQVGAAQQAQVLGDGGTGDREGFGDLSGGLAAAAEEIEDGAAGGIGEGLEGGFGRWARNM